MKICRIINQAIIPFHDNRVTAVDGQYLIGIYSVRPIAYGEEISFDYNSVTEVNVDIMWSFSEAWQLSG